MRNTGSKTGHVIRQTLVALVALGLGGVSIGCVLVGVLAFFAASSQGTLSELNPLAVYRAAITQGSLWFRATSLMGHCVFTVMWLVVLMNAGAFIRRQLNPAGR